MDYDSFQYKNSSVFDVLALVKNETIVIHQIQPYLAKNNSVRGTAFLFLEWAFLLMEQMSF